MGSQPEFIYEEIFVIQDRNVTLRTVPISCQRFLLLGTRLAQHMKMSVKLDYSWVVLLYDADGSSFFVLLYVRQYIHSITPASFTNISILIINKFLKIFVLE